MRPAIERFAFNYGKRRASYQSILRDNRGDMPRDLNPRASEPRKG